MSTQALARPQQGLARSAPSGVAAITADWGTALMNPETIEKALGGDLSPLSPSQRSQYYLARCASMGLDPASKPLDWITFQGKLACYPNVGAAAQLADKRNIQVDLGEIRREDGMLVCRGRGKTPSGRVAERTAYLDVGNAKGQDLANLFMKLESKTFRRVIAALTGWAAADAEEMIEQGGRRVRIEEDLSAQGLQQPSQAALPAVVEEDEKARSQRLAREFLAEWRAQGFSDTDAQLMGDYAKRVLERPMAPASDVVRRADDLAVVLSDLQDRKTALEAAVTAYEELGGDANANGGSTMRRDMFPVLGCEFSSRRDRTSRELRQFADHCKAQQAAEARREDEDEVDGSEVFGDDEPADGLFGSEVTS